MKKAFITGGAGFIGSNIVKLLSEKGWFVTVYDNLSTGYLENLHNIDNIDFINGDILDKETLSNAMNGSDIVFHLAANIGNVKSLYDPCFDSKINILGTLNVLQSCYLLKIKSLVYSSSAAIFGELIYQPIDEKHPVEPDSPYGVSKLAGEKHCIWFGKHYNIRVVCLRYFNVYGINQRFDVYGNVIPIWAKLMMNDEPITIYDDGEQTRDFINAEDVANANYLAAINNNIQGQFNIGSGKSITINKLAELMAKIYNTKSERIYKPKRKGEIRHCKADINKAAQTFGFVPKVSLEEGLTSFYYWQKEMITK